MAHARKNGEPCAPCDDALTYECYWCKRRTLKSQWGPGHIRCPVCHRVAPSPAELAQVDAQLSLMGVGLGGK